MPHEEISFITRPFDYLQVIISSENYMLAAIFIYSDVIDANHYFACKDKCPAKTKSGLTFQ